MVNTDVVIAIAMFNQINPDELWLAFGTGSHFCYTPTPQIHEVVSGVVPGTVLSYQLVQLFTGCDTVSCFGGRGKKAVGKSGKFFLMKHSNTSF